MFKTRTNDSAGTYFIPMEDYLRSALEPDMDSVDGVLEERNHCEVDHADLQTELVTIFRNHRKDWNVRAVVEVRVQVLPNRFRVPDVCIMPAVWKRTPVIREAPMLCIEVKSPEYTLKRERTRAQDFLNMGVPEVWILDPEKRTAYILRGDEMTEQRKGTLRLDGTPIEIELAALFSVLDE